MEKHFKGYIFQHIPRSENNEANKLPKAAAPHNQCLQMYSLKSLRNHPSKSRKYEMWAI
jgi:hypothetical protein